MAAEEDTIIPSNAHQPLNDVPQQSPEDDSTQADIQESDSKILEQKDGGGTELSKSVQEETTIASHEQQADIMEHTNDAKTSHTPTPCISLNYMRDVIVQATKSRFIKPTCSMEPTPEYVDPGIEPVELHNVTELTTNVTSGELGGDDGAGRDG